MIFLQNILIDKCNIFDTFYNLAIGWMVAFDTAGHIVWKEFLTVAFDYKKVKRLNDGQ